MKYSLSFTNIDLHLSIIDNCYSDYTQGGGGGGRSGVGAWLEGVEVLGSTSYMCRSIVNNITTG